MSLRDGTKKMSKSDASDNSRINLTDDADAIASKVRKAKTDPDALPSEAAGLAGRPEADNLVGIFAALKGTTREAVLADYGGAQFSAFKGALVELAVETLAPLGAEMKRLVGRSRAISTPCSPTAPSAPRPSPRRPSTRSRTSSASSAGPACAASDPMTIRALVFDVFGTLVDWRSGMAREAERLLGPTPRI